MSKTECRDFFEHAVHPSTYIKTAKGLRNQGLEFQSIPVLKEGVANFPRDHILWYTLGKSLFFLDRYQESGHALNKCLEIKPNDEQAKNLRTRVYKKISQHERAYRM